MSNPYVGEIRMFAGNFAPVGWALCQGQIVPISENDTLFNVIGTTYGGDGQETFALPNLQSRVPIHQGPMPGGPTYTIGEAAGTETVTLTTQQIPAHNHAPGCQSGGATQAGPGGGVWAQSGSGNYSTNPPNQAMSPNALSPAGGSQPHENMVPFLVINFIISLYGIYPSQS